MFSSKEKQENDFGIANKDLNLIIDVISTYPEVEEALIFGSRAKGNHEKGSDVDLALKGKALTSDIVSKIHWVLEEESPLPYFFDVVHYESLVSTDLKDHIDRRGQKIYSRQPGG